jgi:hypothetical protein
MTEEEAWALDEEVTKNPPRVDPSKARHVSRMVTLDDFSARSQKRLSLKFFEITNCDLKEK